jgi:1-deoxy-D-xylulose-5-phosphate synthase
MGGLRPVVAVYSTFLTRAIDQVMYDVGLHRQPVIFCLDRAGITGDDGPSHHGVLDMALLTKVPGMTILAPSSYQELGQMLHDALAMVEGPVAIRWPKTNARNVPADEVGHGLAARRLREGSDVCLLAVGKMVDAAEQAADALAAADVSATIWDVRAVKPLDPRMILDAGRHPLVLTIEDGVRDGGAGAAMADAISTAALDDGRVGPPVRVLGTPVAYIPHGKPDDILRGLGLDGPSIAGEVRRLLGTLVAR